jgi:hypothetical protein
MAANDLILIQRNTGNTANQRSTIPLGAAPRVLYWDGTALTTLELLDSNGNILDALIPKNAKPRVAVVANQAARFALTTADVQNGDVVWQDDEGKAYFITDDTQLGSNAGYKASASVALAWNDVQNRPTNLAYKVAVPTTATDAGTPGEFAANADNLYVYTGDGTTHTWLQFAGNVF